MVVYHQDRRAALIGLQACWVVLSIIFFIFRIYTRVSIVRTFGIDDYLMGFAVIFSIAISIADSIGAKWGWGVHVDEIVDMNYYHLALMSWISQLLFTICTSFVKASILYFYLRLAATRTYRRVIWGSIIFIGLWCISFSGVIIFQFHPPSAYWTSFRNNTSKFIVVTVPLGLHGIMNTLTDLYVFLLPIPMLWKLQLPRRQRIGLIALFGVGFVVVVAGAIRLYYTIIVVQTFDYTWFGYYLWTWESIEINLGIICACIPATKTLIIRVYPKLFSFSTDWNSNTGAANSDFSPHIHKSTQFRTHSAKSKIFDGSNSYIMGTVTTAASTRTKSVGERDNDSEEFLTATTNAILQVTSFESKVHTKTLSEMDLENIGNAN